MGLRLAQEEFETIELSDGDWIKVRKDVDKRQYRRIAELMPNVPRDAKGVPIQSELRPSDAMQLQSALFGGLVVGWSLDDPCTVENYERLTVGDASRELDEKLGEYFQKLQISADEAGKQET